MNLRTANRHHRRAQRRAVVRSAFEFDLRQMAKGRDRSDSGYVRRRKQRAKRWIASASAVIAQSLNCADRPWFRLHYDGE